LLLLDANILLYAWDESAPHHSKTHAWLTATVQAGESIGLPWVSLWAFVRIVSNPKLMANPLPLEEAFAVMNEILSIPRAVVVQPGPKHAELLRSVATSTQSSGSKLTDASLTALAMEYGATLASTDHDFSRFPSLKWVNPLN
jgi:uncharacterized protein